MNFTYTETDGVGALSFIFIEEFSPPITLNNSHPLWEHLLNLKESGTLSSMEESELLRLLPAGRLGTSFNDWLTITGGTVDSSIYGTLFNGKIIDNKFQTIFSNFLGDDLENYSRISSVNSLLDLSDDILNFASQESLRIVGGNIVAFKSVANTDEGFVGPNLSHTKVNGVFSNKFSLGDKVSSSGKPLSLTTNRISMIPSGKTFLIASVNPESIMKVVGTGSIFVSEYTVLGFGVEALEALQEDTGLEPAIDRKEVVEKVIARFS